MLGRGVKRKRSCSEEDVALTPAGSDETKGGSDLLHLQQRQLVLRLCLDKLQCHQTGMDHGLHRSVLLVNTLRQIQEDMQRDGAGPPHPGTLLSTPDHSGPPLSSVGLPSGYYPPRDRATEDAAPTCPGCAEAGQLVGTALPPAPPPSRPTLSEAAPREGSSVPARHGPTAPVHPGDPASSLGYLTDLAPDNDIFEDIDTSMYESSELSSAWTVYPSWASGMSSWGEEELKMFSSCGSASTLQSCLTDINDLDHIMEILVNS